MSKLSLSFGAYTFLPNWQLTVQPAIHKIRHLNKPLSPSEEELINDLVARNIRFGTQRQGQRLLEILNR